MKKNLCLLFLLLSLVLNAQYAPNQLITPLLDNNSYLLDINGDGFEDIVGVTPGKGQMAWIPNEGGTGEFIDRKLISEIEDVIAPRFADLDGDGDMDVVFLDADENLYYIINTNSLFGFASPQVIDDELDDPCSVSLTLTDIDADGLADVVFGDNCDGMRWYRNMNNGFSDAIIIDEDILAHGLYPKDYDLDGDNDFVGVRDGDLIYLENLDANGAFADLVTIQTDLGNFRDFKIADLNGDGYPDLLHAFASVSKVSWQQNMGDGTFSNPQTLITGNEPRGVAYGDVDGDGDLDVAACLYLDNLTVWFENLDGQGDFSDPIIISSGTQAEEFFGLYLADLDNDGDVDLFAESFYDDLICWKENLDGAGQFGSVIPLSSSGGGNNIGLANLDDTPGLDLVYSNDYGLVFLKNLDGEHHWSTMNVVLPRATFTKLDDVNGDGHLDIIARDTIQNPTNPSGVLGYKIIWMENNGTGNFSGPNLVNSDEYDFLVSADVDLDGDLDIIAKLPYISADLIFFENTNGVGDFSAPQPLFYVNYPDAIFLEDVNGDTYPDLIFNVGSPTDLVWHQNLGNNSFESTPNIIDDSDGYEDLFLAKDLDLDGDIDVIYMDSNDDFIWYENDGSGNFGSGQIIVEDGWQPGAYTIQDVDGDLDLDLVYHVSGFQVFIIHRQEAPGVFGEAEEFDGVSNISSFNFVDVENDGDIDLFTGLIFKENYSNSPVLRGEVFWDQNENGMRDSSEIGLYLQEVDITPNPLVSFTSQDGKFLFPVNPGAYELSCEPSLGWGFGSNYDSSYTIDVPGTNDTIVQNFGLVIIDSTIQVSLDLTSSPTRCGFTVPFWLTIANESPLYIQGNVHAEFDTILFTDQVEFEQVNPAPDSIVGAHVYWSFENLPPTYADQIMFSLEIPGVDFLGDSIEIFSDIAITDSTTDTIFVDNDNYHSVINCAYDPNDKLVEPSFENFDNYTLFSDTLYYTIRFQNTGTDTAFTVRVEDALDLNLDWTTFRIVSASHLHETLLDESGKLTFTFNNILLPPQSQNEVGSQGFVKFAIEPREDVTEFSQVYNTGHIFFDFNPPIITNAVTNVLVSEYPIIYEALAPLCHDSNEGTIAVSFPPPLFNFLWSDGSTLSTLNNLSEGEYSLEIYNEWGEVVADSLIEVTAPEILSNTAITTTPATTGNANGTATADVMGGTEPYTYDWGTLPPQASNTAIDLAAGDYQLTITDANGCTLIEAFSIESITSVTHQIQNDHLFKLTPNPSTGACLVEWKSLQGDWELNVYNTLGQKVRTYQSIDLLSNQSSLLVDELESGTYFVQLNINGLMATRRLLVLE